jgi:mutator family transposase
MGPRIPASEQTHQRLEALLKEGVADGDARSELFKLAVRKIVEEALEAEVSDALGRGYYESGAEPGRGYRNGSRRGRLRTAEGAIEYGVPQVADRAEPFVIHKQRIQARGLIMDPRDVAWEYLLQRLERFTTLGGTQVRLIRDEGEGQLVRRLARKARRAGVAGTAFGTGYLRRPARLLVDDPVPRRSGDSFFTQMADLAAYAAFRRLYPPPERPVQIVPTEMWDEISDARNPDVNRVSGGPVRGIVSWPA